jgi:class 3 adenylate cyclase
MAASRKVRASAFAGSRAGTEQLAEAARHMGLQVRTGVHTGEVEHHGEELSGICVNIAARVADRARGSEVLLTETVRDLVEGAAFRFADADTAELKGIGPRRLVRLVRA